MRKSSLVIYLEKNLRKKYSLKHYRKKEKRFENLFLEKIRHQWTGADLGFSRGQGADFQKKFSAFF